MTNDDISRLVSGLPKALEALNTPDYARRAAEALQASVPKIPDFAFPAVSSPDYKLPDIHIPSPQERNHYQSAAVLMQAIAQEAMEWKERLPANYRPAVLAVMYGGIQIKVQTLSQVSFHGIRIEGAMNDAPCSLFAHQSTVQLLCYGEEITTESKHHPIGFVWDTNKVEV